MRDQVENGGLKDYSGVEMLLLPSDIAAIVTLGHQPSAQDCMVTLCQQPYCATSLLTA